MKFEQIEYTIPEWALCALINGDESGLSDQDCADLNAFLATVPGQGHWGYDSESESYFSHHNDINGLGSTVVDVIWNQIIED